MFIIVFALNGSLLQVLIVITCKIPDSYECDKKCSWKSVIESLPGLEKSAEAPIETFNAAGRVKLPSAPLPF